MFLLAYYITTAIVFLFLGVVWTRNGWHNTLLKMSFVVLTIWAALNIAMQSGLVLKG